MKEIEQGTTTNALEMFEYANEHVEQGEAFEWSAFSAFGLVKTEILRAAQLLVRSQLWEQQSSAPRWTVTKYGMAVSNNPDQLYDAIRAGARVMILSDE